MNALTWGWDGPTSRLTVTLAICCLTICINKLIRIRLLFYCLRKDGLVRESLHHENRDG